MNTKEAIRFLEYGIKLFPHKAETLPVCLEIYKIAERIEDIIEVLKDGEKYEAITNDIERDFDDLHCNILSKNSFNIIKQKYFPKPKTEKWERFINVDFPNSKSVIVKMVAIKKPDGNIMISYEPQYNFSEKLEEGGEI